MQKICPKCWKMFPLNLEACPNDSTPLVLPVDRDLTGTRLDAKYDVIGLIGEGGMGYVYKAHHFGLDREVAIKVLRSAIVHDETVVKRFINEARASAKLKSPNTITLHDARVSAEGLLYYEMELLDGQSLAAIIREHAPIDPAVVVGYILQACDSLEEAHNNGILHRDIKPDNLFLARFGDKEILKVLDFGIAKMLSSGPTDTSLTSEGMVVGTPQYLSPEQASGIDVVPASDLYSLAVVLYELLTGNAPFNERTPILTMAAHARTPPPPLSSWGLGIPREDSWQTFLDRALAKRLEDRFASVAEFRKELLATAGIELAAVPGTGQYALRPHTHSKTSSWDTDEVLQVVRGQTPAPAAPFEDHAPVRRSPPPRPSTPPRPSVPEPPATRQDRPTPGDGGHRLTEIATTGQKAVRANPEAIQGPSSRTPLPPRSPEGRGVSEDRRATAGTQIIGAESPKEEDDGDLAIHGKPRSFWFWVAVGVLVLAAAAGLFVFLSKDQAPGPTPPAPSEASTNLPEAAPAADAASAINSADVSREESLRSDIAVDTTTAVDAHGEETASNAGTKEITETRSTHDAHEASPSAVDVVAEVRLADAESATETPTTEADTQETLPPDATQPTPASSTQEASPADVSPSTQEQASGGTESATDSDAERKAAARRTAAARRKAASIAAQKEEAQRLQQEKEAREKADARRRAAQLEAEEAAKAEAEKEQAAYQSRLKAARSAKAKGKYAQCIKEAKAALLLKPDDSTATALIKDCQDKQSLDSLKVPEGHELDDL